jgi:4-amino-4-deoxy-L-arabinose transferase-like glycosyltransferase
MEGTASDRSGTHRLLAPAIAAALALLTLGYGFTVHTLRFAGAGFIGDSEDYYLFAGNLCHEGVFSGDREGPPRPSAFRPPLFPAMLSVLMKTVGYEGFLAKARILQLAIFAASVVVVFILARLMFGLHTAVLAGVLLALYFPLVFSTTQLTTEPIAMLLLASCLVAFQLWRRDGRTAMLAVSGFLLGLGALARPNLLFVLPVFAVLILVRRRVESVSQRLVVVAMLVLSTMVCILPWTARNAVQLGGFSLVSTNGGLNFYLGHVPDFDPTLAAPGTDYGIYRRLRDQGLSEIEADRRLYRMGVEFMVSHPVDELRNIWIKSRALMKNYAEFLHPWPLWPLAIAAYLLARLRKWQLVALVVLIIGVTLALTAGSRQQPGDLLMLFAASWTLFWPLAVLGIGLARKRGEALGLLLPVWLSAVAAGILYIPLARIRWSVDFIPAMLAAVALHELGSRLLLRYAPSGAPPRRADK